MSCRQSHILIDRAIQSSIRVVPSDYLTSVVCDINIDEPLLCDLFIDTPLVCDLIINQPLVCDLAIGEPGPLCDLIITGYDIEREEVFTQNYYLNFNGTDQYANLGYLDNYSTDYLEETTVELEFSTESSEGMFLFGASNSGFGSGLEVSINRYNDSDIPGRIRLQYRDAYDDGQNILSTTTDHPEIYDGKRHTISVAVNGPGQQFKIYLDGVELDTNLQVTESWDGDEEFNNPWTIGARRADLSYPRIFTGSMYQHRIWTEMLTEEQINTNLNTYLKANNWAESYPNLFRYYRFNSGEGTQLIEEIEGDHGVIEGNTNNIMWIKR